MKVERLLKKYDLLDDNVKRVDYHMKVLKEDADELVFRMLKIKDLEEKKLALTISELISKCDYNNPEYDAKVDEEMIRFGLKTDKYDNNRATTLWHNGNDIPDIDNGVGNKLTDMMDDQMDFQSDFEHFKK